MDKMDDAQLVSVCTSELARSLNGIGDQQDISHDLDYYLGRLPGLTNVEQKDPKASRIVSMDIMDAVESTTAEIMQMFSGDEIAYYQASGPEDEEQARLESDLVNYLFLEEYDGYSILQTALKDALIHRNGVIKVYWDSRISVSYEEYSNVPEVALADLLEPTQPTEQVEVIEQVLDGEHTEAAQVETENGAAIVEVNIETYSFKIKRSRVVEKPIIECVPPEQVKVGSDHNSPYLQDARFIAHEKIETESSLIEQGFDPEIVKQLPSHTSDSDFLINIARSRNATETLRESDHHSTRLIYVAECYPLIDYDGDGIAERRKVVIAGNQLLSNIEFDRVPLISGIGINMPHKYQGISLVDRLKDIQEGKTPLLRSIIDGAKLSANPRTGVVTGNVNIEDLLMSRTGGVVRANDANSVFPLPHPDIPQSVFHTMTFLDGQRRERGGSAVDTATQAQALSGDTAHGIERTMSAMELNNSMVARTFGETGVRGIFIELHYLLRKHQQEPVNAQVGGRWLQSTPIEWGERTKVSIHVGSSNSERAQQLGAMTRVIDMHRELHGMGAPLVDVNRSYRAIVDATRLAGIKSPDRYFIDPQSEEGQAKIQHMEAEAQKTKVEREQMELAMIQSQQGIAQAEQRKAVAQQQSAFLKAENDRLKAQLEGIKNDDDTVLKARKQSNDFALAVTGLELDHNKEVSAAVEGNR